MGSATFPLTSHALVPVLLDGQALVDRLPVSMSEDAMPVGVSVAHCVLRFEKSGEIGVGVLYMGNLTLSASKGPKNTGGSHLYVSAFPTEEATRNGSGNNMVIKLTPSL